MRQLDERWHGEFAKLAFTTVDIAEGTRPVGWLYREPTDREGDSGWNFMVGDEDDEYLDDAKNFRLVPLRTILEKHPELEATLRTPAPCAFALASDGTISKADGTEGA